MKYIESLELEELKSLLEGKNVGLIKDENNDVSVEINGKNFIGERFEFILNVLKMSQREFYRLENIFERYYGEEYFDYETEEQYEFDDEAEE